MVNWGIIHKKIGLRLPKLTEIFLATKTPRQKEKLDTDRWTQKHREKSEARNPKYETQSTTDEKLPRTSTLSFLLHFSSDQPIHKAW